MYDKEILEIFDKLNIVDKLYDKIRMIDPVLKRVIHDNTEAVELPVKCFEFWGNNKKCENCVAMRAYNDDKTYVKIESTQNDVFMLTAIPVNLHNRRVVIELFKNITESMVFGKSNGIQQNEMQNMIDRMHNLATVDSLTGIYNRRYIYEKLPVVLSNSIMTNHSIALIMADIDFFKNVNDTYGHLAGDYVLKTFAQVLCEGLNRESDWVARYGGEEFIICLPGAKQNAAIEIAERLREAVEYTKLNYDEQSFQITASFGVCSIVPDVSIKSDQLIECADKKLYEAKRNGRNRVEA
ncbi:GGDEF domain-containing protein [Mobilitalea sibirica]|uniref:GGDEF domain-containing protein n=1 Tax=Mobilitalea sibirica TaxID=1462919 RepID=A0A8J7H710_9FIRM|nr:GGDEF domain-containing protein [Mobilitalea sibirica]MBH1940846.1 GGDEF domain-containing protein [Mobilitalea sibirica]